MKYAFWNNKGGTGKTSLLFQVACHYANANRRRKILVVDLCPQANLSELLLGSLEGAGSQRLVQAHADTPRRSIAGYFQARLPSPYAVPQFNPHDFLIRPSPLNQNIPANITLLPGDGLVELQANAMSTLANTQLPGVDTWLAVVSWLKDFLDLVSNDFDDVFIDTNPSFAIYTQIALASADRLVLPVMADDSSRRALQNAFALVHGINLPAALYAPYTLSRLAQSGRTLPQAHLVVKNRLTQYMGVGSAYYSVLTSIDAEINRVLQAHPTCCTFTATAAGTCDVRDFHTTGVIAFAEGNWFANMNSGNHYVQGRQVQLSRENLDNCRDAIMEVVNRL